MTERWTYIAGRHGCHLFVKAGGSTDLARRLRSIREDRTLTPLTARGRAVALLATWREQDGPTEADVLAELDDARWRSPTGHLSEYVWTGHTGVAALLAERCPEWHDLLDHDPGALTPIRRATGPPTQQATS